MPTAAALLLLTGIACAAPSSGLDRLGLPLHHRVTHSEVAAAAGTIVLFPGSRVLRRVGSDERPQAGGDEPAPAYAGVIASVATSPRALLRWYAEKLAARYRAATYYRATDEVAGRAWTIPDTKDQIQVAVYRPNDPAGQRDRRRSIRYREILVDYRVSGPPPQP